VKGVPHLKRLTVLLTVIFILCSCILAQESNRQTVSINFKDTTKKAVTGTLISLDMKQISVETDEVRHLGLKIDLQQVASIIFFDIPLRAMADKPTPINNADIITCGTVSIKRPELRDLRLGMHIVEVKAVKPSLRTTGYTSEVGEQSAIGVNPEKGVRSIRLEFLDGRLTFIKVSYDSSVSWNSEQEFLSRIAEAFGLPKSWNGLLQCDGLNFEAEYNYGISPEVRLYNPTAAQTVKKRRAEIEEKKRRDFKP
jgi:hypothetical protein